VEHYLRIGIIPVTYINIIFTLIVQHCLWKYYYDFFTHFYLHVVSVILVGKPEGKRPLGRPRRRWRDNINMDLLATGLSVVD
jgi:hypothetical protein